MLTRLRPGKPSPALVISCIALFVALSGASYAAIVLPKNSVGTPQLKKGAVSTAKMKNNAVTGAKVNEATLGQVPSAANAANAGSAANADKVDNYHANELLRVEQSTFSGSLGLSGGDGNLLNGPTITAPHAGYLLVNATGTFDLVAGGWQVRCGVDVDTLGGSAWAANHHSSNLAENTYVSSANTGPFPCGITRRFPVDAGPHTVRFKARAEFGAGATALGSQITVLYVPFGPNG